MKGLIIKEPWIDLILEGKKTWEIRGAKTTIRGTIYLIKSGTKKIYGAAELVDCLELDKKLFLENKLFHRIEQNELPYPKTFAWVLQNPKRFDEPIPYIHPQGAIIWVNV